MVIIGAQGLAKELLAVLEWNGNVKELLFFDNVNVDAPDLLYGQFPVIKSWDALEKHFLTDSPEFVMGVGGARERKGLADKVVSLGGSHCSVVSNHALVGRFGNSIGKGVAILSQATITTDVIIGEGTLINKAVIISHDAKIGTYCELSPGAKILGRAKVGDFSTIGANATVLPGIRVGSNCKVGAGAVVTKDVEDYSIVTGIPARPLKKK